MSEHAWVLEHIAVFNAGGLDAAERDQLRQHVAACTACAQVLNEAGKMDRALEGLFAEVSPDPALEDRMVQLLRARSSRGRKRNRFLWWVAASAAAVVLSGALGSEMSNATLGRELLFPGMVGTAMGSRAFALNNLEPMVLAGGGSAVSDIRAPGYPPAPMRSARELAEQLREGAIGMATKQNGIAFADESATVPRKPVTVAAGDGRLATGLRTDAGELAGPAYAGNFSPAPTPTDDLDQKQSTYRSGRPATKARDHATLEKESAKEASPADETYFKPSQLTSPLPQDSKAPVGHPDARTSGGPPNSKPDDKEKKGSPERKPVEYSSSPLAARKLIIRSGDIEFEVESFDAAVLTIGKIVGGINGGFVATVNSEKLANGKVRGAVVVRIPPESLDKLILDLRKELGKTGELKSQRIGSQDISKQYTDLESRLRAARAMQERLLQIIKTGKGEIKDLVQAEKELGVWRTKIEEIEGELRYYANLVALSTLTITLYEKEIRAPFAITETERIQMGLEVDDVDKARELALAAVAEVKGRVIKSELKQYAAGQYSALLQFEVAPEAAGPLRDRLKQLGNLARLEIVRLQQTEGGDVPRQDTRLKRNDSQFFVSLYDLAKVEPREKTDLQIATRDVPAGYRAVLEAVTRAKGRVLNAQLNEQDKQNITAQVDLDVRREEGAAIETTFSKIGDVYSRNVMRAQASENVTDSKVRLKVNLLNAAQIPPRETYTLAVEVADVDHTAATLSALVHEKLGRTVESHVARRADGSVIAKQVFDVPLTAVQGLLAQFKGTGTIRVEEAVRNPQVPDTALAIARLDVTLSNEKLLVPSDDGLWPQVRKGLSNSLLVIFWSLSWVIFGLLVVLPWVLLLYGAYRLVLRFRKRPGLATRAD
jgi:hypothetical protein